MSRKELKDMMTKALKPRRYLSTAFLIGIVVFAVVLSAVVFYAVGKNDAIHDMERQQMDEEIQEVEKGLINQDLVTVKETFFKFIMIKTMVNYKQIFTLIIAILILRAIFR